MTKTFLAGVAGLSLVALAACGAPRDVPVAEIDCHAGLYQSASGEALALTPTMSTGYRWRTLDGRTGAIGLDGGASNRGWTEQPDGNVVTLGDCASNQIAFGPASAPETFVRVPLQVTDTTFERDGLTFSGRLIWPANVDRAPLTVHVHGSEQWSAVRSGSMQYMLAAEGIASFVFDKRGTGQSEGKYTQDFHALAADAIAALAEARRLAGDRATSVGFVGGSQGGWVGPLAASESEVDFVVNLYGMAEGALAEDRNEVIGGLARAGWGEEEQAHAAELADAAGVIMASNFTEGFAEFDRRRNLYKNEPWYGDVEGEFTGAILPYPEFALRIVGPMRNLGTSWTYDPMPVLRGLDEQQFWVIAAEDSEAPPAETIRRLRALQSEGRPIDIAIYPNADHGMIVLEGEGEAAQRVGHVQNYFRQVAAWINTRDLSFARAAGAEVVTLAPAAPDPAATPTAAPLTPAP